MTFGELLHPWRCAHRFRGSKGADLGCLALAVLVAALVRPAWADVAPRVTVGRLRIQMQRIVSQPPVATMGVPLYMDTANDNSGRMFFAEQVGRVRVRQPNGTITTFLDISAETLVAGGQRGLLGMTFHPGFADPLSPGYRKFYTYHSVDPEVVPGTPDFNPPSGGFDISHHNVVTEWQADASNPNVVDLSSRREVFREAHVGGVGNIHNGGMLEFGPDGYMYGTIGTPADNPTQRLFAQNLATIQGKIFRIDPLDPSSTPLSTDPVSVNGKYRTPSDNPFVDLPGALDEVYAWGIRHLHRMSFDPANGLLFAGDVGDGSREELDVVAAGDNLGYPYYEGTIVGPVPPPAEPPPNVMPIAEYSHDDGRVIVAGYTYRGTIEALQGLHVYGEFSWAKDSLQPFLCCAGRLFFSDPYDAVGELKDRADIRIEEILTAPATCAQSLTVTEGCTFDSTLMSLATDDDGEIYTVSNKSNKAVVYKITDAYFLPEGDYNEDGTVDARDYTLWRDTLGQSVLFQPAANAAFEGHGTKADGDRDGVIDLGDYDVWKVHYGETVSLGSGGASLAVPEPASAGLAFVAAATVGCLSRRVRHPRRRPTNSSLSYMATI